MQFDVRPKHIDGRVDVAGSQSVGDCTEGGHGVGLQVLESSFEEVDRTADSTRGVQEVGTKSDNARDDQTQWREQQRHGTSRSTDRSGQQTERTRQSGGDRSVDAGQCDVDLLDGGQTDEDRFDSRADGFQHRPSCRERFGCDRETDRDTLQGDHRGTDAGGSDLHRGETGHGGQDRSSVFACPCQCAAKQAADRRQQSAGETIEAR